MKKPTVESISLVFNDEKECYATVMTVDTISDVKYVVLEVGKYKDTEMKYAQDIADRLGLELVDETKEDITISGGVSPELIKGITEKQRIVTDKCIIYKSPMPNQYYFTYVDGCPSHCDSAGVIAEVVNMLNEVEESPNGDEDALCDMWCN